jgi:hypothetical protein
MKIYRIEPRTDPLWLQLVTSSASDVFHSPAWMQVVAETYGFAFSAYVLVDDSGIPVAGLPFTQIADLRGERNVTMPFSDYCDPLVHTPEQWCTLVEPLVTGCCPYTIRCLHNNIPLQDGRFALVNQAKWHGLDLTPALGCLWEQIDSTARRAIRKAEQAEVIVRIADCQETLRAFYQLHLGVRKQKYRMLAQPYLFFANIWRHFIEPGHGALLYATHEDRVIGATLLLEWQNKIYYKFNASTAKQLAVRPNDLMIWRAIQYAKTKGYTYWDFGLSDWDQEGLVRYKRKFATEEKTISFLRYSGQAGVDPHRQDWNQLAPQLTTLFTDESVPDAITEAAGTLLYRFFA